MWDAAQKLGADYLATGHYAKIRQDPATGRHLLCRGADPSKDQSYFLCRLTQEQLSHTLTVIRHRVQEGGQLIVAVEPSLTQTQMNVRVVKTSDGAGWWTAFTGFEEELKGADSVKSTFLTDMGKLFQTALTVPKIQGVILNPWNRTLMLDKHLIEILLPKKE